MSTYVVRPLAGGIVGTHNPIDSTINSGSTFGAGTTDANIATYIGDQSDATAVRAGGAAWSIFQARMAAASGIPTDEFVARVGGFIKWSHGANGKHVSITPYRYGTDNVPAYGNSVVVDGRTTATVTEPAVMLVSWSRADMASLAATCYLEGDSTGANRPWAHEFGVNIYTLKLATSVPAASTTMTTTTYPTIQFTTTVGAMDWEVGTYDWQTLRKVTTEVRIESGGTGAGTGTLVATKLVDSLFTAAGSITANAVFTTAIANGTYKVYTRAIRYRDNNVSDTDTTGVWSTAGTLTMSLVPPAAPTIDYANVTANYPAVGVQVTTVSNAVAYINPRTEVQRSEDGGTTWVDAFSMGATFGTYNVALDNKASRGVALKYRARTYAFLGGIKSTGDWSTVVNSSGPIPLTGWNLREPVSFSKEIIGLNVIGSPGESVSEDLGVFRALDRRYPVVVSGTLTGWDGDLTVFCASLAEWTALKTLIELQTVLLLQSPFGWQKYIRILPGTSATMLGSQTLPQREVKLTYVETSAP